jgi:hypothetical protein
LYSEIHTPAWPPVWLSGRPACRRAIPRDVSLRYRSKAGIPIRTVKDIGTPRSRCLSRQPDCWAPQSIPLNTTLRRTLLHGVPVLCVAPDILGNPDGDLEPVRSCCCGNDQRCWQRGRYCRSLRFRLATHSNGTFFARPGPDDGLSASTEGCRSGVLQGVRRLVP